MPTSSEDATTATPSVDTPTDIPAPPSKNDKGKGKMTVSLGPKGKSANEGVGEEGPRKRLTQGSCLATVATSDETMALVV